MVVRILTEWFNPENEFWSNLWFPVYFVCQVLWRAWQNNNMKTDSFLSPHFWYGSCVWTAVPVDYIISSHLSVGRVNGIDSTGKQWSNDTIFFFLTAGQNIFSIAGWTWDISTFALCMQLYKKYLSHPRENIGCGQVEITQQQWIPMATKVEKCL